MRIIFRSFGKNKTVLKPAFPMAQDGFYQHFLSYISFLSYNPAHIFKVYALMAHLILVDLARGFFTHSCVEGRITSSEISLYTPAFFPSLK